ncbi:MAG TPA: hypothetical protein VNI54_04775 [Thermoanaerobaculia bacterium]|nr:hypothetical protein [Thermoanaerobaculia bacterium]
MATATPIDRAGVLAQSASFARGRRDAALKKEITARMRIITVNSQPYTVINGKDFAVYRWFAPGQHGPLFIQVAGRTALTRDDLPSDDWFVIPGRDRGHRLATAWRKPWFDYRLDATRKLAFLGGSTEGSFYLALRYLVRRFGLAVSETELATMSGTFAGGGDLPYPHVWSIADDLALSSAKLVTLDVPSYWDADDARRVFAA